jgi:hypothetical protein
VTSDATEIPARGEDEDAHTYRMRLGLHQRRLDAMRRELRDALACMERAAADVSDALVAIDVEIERGEVSHDHRPLARPVIDLRRVVHDKATSREICRRMAGGMTFDEAVRAVAVREIADEEGIDEDE